MNKTITLKPLDKPTTGTVTIPGSKSVTNRALVMAALTEGEVVLKYPLWSDDTEAMIDCLENLGIAIVKEEKSLRVLGSVEDVFNRTTHLNARHSGTTIRFILALSTILPGITHLEGVGRLNERPIKGLVEGLRQIGADITYDNHEGFPPLTIGPGEIVGGATVHMEGNVSSQYFTALLMMAPAIGGLTIEVVGEQISKSYIDITLEMMHEWGIDVVNEDYAIYEVPAGEYTCSEYTIEGDYSAAGYFGGIAALTGSTITLENLSGNSTQGDKEFFHILQDMGNEVTFTADSITIRGSCVKAVTVDMEQCPDQAQTLAVLAAFADGKTVMTGVRSLRLKETERVKAVQAELGKMGIKTDSPDDDTLIVYGGTPQAATIDTYQDHRMAMSFAMAGTVIQGMKINDPEVVKKTFPEYWEKLKSLGIEVISGE